MFDLTEVIGGLVVVVVVAVARWVWVRRRQAADWISTGRDALEARRRRIAAVDHDELVTWVLQRAKTLTIQVPVAVQPHPGYITVTFHPSGSQSHFVPDLERYRHLLEAGHLPPARTFAKPWTKPPVHQWSAGSLRDWLDHHADRLPEPKSFT